MKNSNIVSVIDISNTLRVPPSTIRRWLRKAYGTTESGKWEFTPKQAEEIQLKIIKDLNIQTTWRPRYMPNLESNNLIKNMLNSSLPAPIVKKPTNDIPTAYSPILPTPGAVEVSVSNPIGLNLNLQGPSSPMPLKDNFKPSITSERFSQLTELMIQEGILSPYYSRSLNLV